MSELGAVALWRFREKIQFGKIEYHQLANGNPVSKFKPEFTRNAARYRISTRMILSNSGLDWEHDKVFAIRHLNDKDWTNYKAKWDGRIYNVTNVIPDDTKIVSADLITLHLADKNG